MSTAPAPAIILVRPQLGENIGMAARAMANFGLSDLRLVAPRDGWGHDAAVTAVALDAAVGARELVERAGLFADVAAAAADLTHLYATTARERGQAKPVLTPEEAVIDCATRVAGRGCAGLLFGPERTGLTSDEVAAADAIVTFPVSPRHPSVNLAQSVGLMAYLFGSRVMAPPVARPADPAATQGMKQAFFDRLIMELDQAGYFLVPGKEAIMRRNLLNIFRRLDLTEADVRTLTGAVVALAEGRRRRGRTLRPDP